MDGVLKQSAASLDAEIMSLVTIVGLLIEGVGRETPVASHEGRLGSGGGAMCL